MAQPATNAKIEELRFRLKTDPKSRLFYPLAEELRKAGQLDEAEQVLRTGLANHVTYLSAWVSLGRVLRDQKKDDQAVEALSRALQLDPGNVVAARFLGDAYLSLGDKVEAIKKYKLVHALMPADEELEAMIESLDRELHPPEPAEPEPSLLEDTVVSGAPGLQPAEDSGGLRAHSSTDESEDSPFDRTMPPFDQAASVLGEEDAEPMAAAHEESPFEEPVSEYTAAAMTVEAPVGMHMIEAPAAAEVPTEVSGAAPASGAELPAAEAAAAPQDNTKIARLESWLSKVARKEVNGV